MEDVPSTLPQAMWSEPSPESFRVRSRGYLRTRLKEPCAALVFSLRAVDLFELDGPTQNIAAHPANRVGRSPSQWFFVVNIMVPGPPHLSFVMYFVGDKADTVADTAFGRIAKPFFEGSDDEFRNRRFKLVPEILEGSYLLALAVQNKPALLGTKLAQHYHKGANYFEVDVDVGSSVIARHTGDAEEELPEVLLGACTFAHADLGCACKLASLDC